MEEREEKPIGDQGSSRSRTGRIGPGARALLWLPAIALLAALADRVARTGPIEARAPRTIFSNGNPATRGLAPYLLFLAEVRDVLPPGARVRVLPPEWLDPSSGYLVAVGQLPRQLVLTNDAEGTEEFIASFEHPRPGAAVPHRQLPDGYLYRRNS